jgi:hypothetical protein
MNQANIKHSFVIYPDNRPTKLYITVETRQPTELFFSGFDPDPSHPNTFYFKERRKTVRGKETLEFPMPLAPVALKVVVFTRSVFPFVLHGHFTKPLVIAPFSLNRDEIEGIEFLLNFAEQAGYLPLGNYTSPNDEFVIMYQNKIDGVTPARVHRLSGVMKASQQDMIRLSVPVRYFVMGHELCHHILPTKNEERADGCSLRRYYLNLGFPQTEANYSMTKIFGDSSNRARLVNEGIMEHDYSIRKRISMI